MDHDEPSFPEKMMFDANLSEFGSRVGIICGLESGGKISQAEAFEQIKRLWKKLKQSRKNLRIGNEPPE